MDDTEYKNFLYECYKSPVEPGNDTNTEDNDPTYVYNDDIFSHGWRFDLDEALNDQDQEIDDENQLHLIQYNRADAGQQQQQQQIYDENARSADSNYNSISPAPVIICHDDIRQSTTEQCHYPQASSLKATAQHQFQPTIHPVFQTPVTPDLRSPNKRRKLDIFQDPEFVRILNLQLRQHIQLLTQTFLLTTNTTNMRNYADMALEHLNSYMKIFKHKTKPSNLLSALEIVNNLPISKDLQPGIRLSWRHLPIPDTVKKTIYKYPRVFIYKNLTPQVAFSLLPEKLIPKKSKINFTINEDKLLAFALNEFKGESSQYAFIASLLMTAKTKMQISNHIKNIKRSPGNEDSPLKLYFSQGEMPKIDLDADSEIVGLGNFEDDIDNQLELNLSTELSNQSQLKKQENDPGPRGETRLAEVDEKLQGDMKQDQSIEILEKDQILQTKRTTISPDDAQMIDDDRLVFYHDDDIMSMDLDDLMAASTTITKSNLTSSNSENKNVKNIKLKRSMLNLMSHKFSLSPEMGDKIIHDFLKTSQDKLSDRNYIHLLQLLTNLMKKEIRVEASLIGNNNNNNNNNNNCARGDPAIKIYKDISEFLHKVQAPPELNDKLILFLNFDQAAKCDCALNYLHWMRFFEFIQHVEMYHDGEAFEKRLTRLIDALQKNDPHKFKLAAANLVSKNPLLKRDFDSLSLEGKPHASLFTCEEDFDDITEPISMIDNETIQHQTSELAYDKESSSDIVGQVSPEKLYTFEHFQSKLSKEEAHYATQLCPCNCHGHLNGFKDKQHHGQPIGQHCGKCNLKFIKGKMYLVNKIKPILAKWSYINTKAATSPTQQASRVEQPSPKAQKQPISNDWTFEEDKEILEFCQAKAEQNEETVSFDSSIFEEFVQKRRHSQGSGDPQVVACKRSARQIAERFNQLMEMYRMDENSTSVG